jgi:hypothetical protein
MTPTPHPCALARACATLPRRHAARGTRTAALGAAVLAGLGGGVQMSAAVGTSVRAQSASHATLSATLNPKRLGHGTTVGLSIAISGPGDRPPPPLRTLAIRYPQSLGIALSGLGIETCTAATLEADGPAGCPRDSIMGHGSALGEIPFGPELIREGATVTIVRAQDQHGELALLFDAEGISPVKANIVLPALLEEARPPYGGRIAVSVPLIPSLPEAPDVSIASLQARIGPAGLIYYERKHGEAVPYRPKGILLPRRCPRGGFPFAATLSFYGGARAQARTHVRCPPAGRAGRRRRARRKHRRGAANAG